VTCDLFLTCFFLERPFNTAGHAHSGTYRHRNGGEEGMYNRVVELLKGGQRVKTVLGRKQLRYIATHYGKYVQNTHSYGVYAPQLRRPANPYHEPCP
jgi:hypothetical protein